MTACCHRADRLQQHLLQVGRAAKPSFHEIIAPLSDAAWIAAAAAMKYFLLDMVERLVEALRHRATT